MGTEFHKPQRQSAAGIAIMFAYNIQYSIRVLILPIALLMVNVKASDYKYFAIAFLGYLSIVALFSYISYLKFSFFLDERKQEFVIQKGLLNKQVISIQLNKIQQANISQSLLQRIIGVYSIDIDTAGSDKKEASIKAVDHRTASLLKERLLNRNTGETIDTPTENNSSGKRSLLKLNPVTLLKIGLTSNYGASLGLLTGFIYALIDGLESYAKLFGFKGDLLKELMNTTLTLLSLGILLIVALLIVLATNIIRNFIKYYGFEVRRNKQSLTISSGLFAKTNTLLKPDKVQISSFSQNFFQKKLNLLNMKIKQASYETADNPDEDHKKTDIDIPSCNEYECDEVLKMIFTRLPDKGTACIPNYRFIIFTIMFKIIIPISAFIAIGYWFYLPLKSYFNLMGPYSIIVSIMLYFEFRNHRLYISEDFIIKKSGIWDVEHQIIEPHKIQSIMTRQYFWHKKADIGHLILHTAAGTLYFKYGNYTEIHHMVNYWLFKLESGKKDWM